MSIDLCILNLGKSISAVKLHAKSEILLSISLSFNYCNMRVHFYSYNNIHHGLVFVILLQGWPISQSQVRMHPIVQLIVLSFSFITFISISLATRSVEPVNKYLIAIISFHPLLLGNAFPSCLLRTMYGYMGL